MKEVTDEEMVGSDGDYYLQDTTFKIAFITRYNWASDSKYSPVSDVPAVSNNYTRRGTHAWNRLICPPAKSTQ